MSSCEVLCNECVDARFLCHRSLILAIRWLSGSRQSMQRLGFCKAIVLRASRARSGPELTELLREDLLTSKFWVASDDRFLECLGSRSKAGDLSTSSGHRIEVSLQDYYICHHPSNSGWLSHLGAKEYAERLPRYLGLLDSAYRLTDFGRVLSRGLLSREEMDAFQAISVDLNPLTLTLPQKVFFLYILLAKDGDFLMPFTKALSTTFGTHVFSYLDAGEVVPQVLKTLLDRFWGSGYTKEEREQLRQLRSALASIEEAIATQMERQGSGSRREQTTIPRMEWLIDVGLAEKASSDEGRRSYKLTDSGHDFASAFSTEYEKLLRTKYPDEALASLLDEGFFRLVQASFAGKESGTPQQTDTVEYLRPAYDILTGVSGYCAIRPLLLLANALYVSEGYSVMEYADVLKGLEEAYRANPERVYYTITRRGTDYQVRIGP